MKLTSDWSSVLALIAAVAATVFTILIAITAPTPISGFSLPFAMALVLLIVSFLTFVLTTLNKNPASLKIAVVGQPKAGKTVFLSVLFDRIQILKTSSITFYPYGRETIEQVASNLNTLQAGYWLKPTSKDSVFFFRANASVRGTLSKRRYTVEIGDYAGERVEEFDSSSEGWLHRTEYFKYVIGCDAVILAVDAHRIIEQEKLKIEEMQNALIAALQVLIDEKGIPADRKLRTPIALVILKSDLLTRNEFEPKYVFDTLDRLIALCKKKCRHFEIFFVSALGSVSSDDTPPKTLYPVNVCDPMVWILKHAEV